MSWREQTLRATTFGWVWVGLINTIFIGPSYWDGGYTISDLRDGSERKTKTKHQGKTLATVEKAIRLTASYTSRNKETSTTIEVTDTLTKAIPVFGRYSVRARYRASGSDTETEFKILDFGRR